MVNPSTELAISITKSLLAIGITDAVLCPGSRSAPIAWQLADLANKNRIKLHTRIDEREAGFLALGIAKATRRPVPVLVTSGTAVANLLPSVVEAFHSGIPLIVISADRPENIRGNSAPQTTNQVGIFSNFVKAQVDTAVPTDEILFALEKSVEKFCGPIHINAQFDLPLMPEEIENNLGEVKVKVPQAEVFPAEQLTLDLPAKGLVVIGDAVSSNDLSELEDLASKCGYPIIWEPTAQLSSSQNVIDHGALILQTQKTPTPEVVISAGLVGLSRSVLNLFKATPRHIAIHLPQSGPEIPNPVLTAKEVFSYVPKVRTQVDSTWLELWQRYSQIANQVISSKLNSNTLTGPGAAVELWKQVPNNSTFVLAPSWPIRHIELYAPNRTDLITFGNRGVNGIDGLISTAAGIALKNDDRTYLLIGDIAFLHGMGGLNISAPNQTPNLTVVVLDNDGSGIFSQLEQGSNKYQKYFEQIFGTPHGKDLWVIAESLGVPAARVTTKTELTAALNRTNRIPGLHVIVCSTGSRQNEQLLIEEISTELKGRI